MIDIVDPRTGELMDTDSVPGLAEVAALHAEHLEALTDAVEQLTEDQVDPARRTRTVRVGRARRPDGCQGLA